MIIQTKRLLIVFSILLASAHAQQYEWARSIGGTSGDTAFDICADTSGNSWAVGLFTFVADFNDGPGTVNLGSPGSGTGFILKSDSSGNYVMAKTIGGNGGMGRSIDSDDAGYIYVTGDLVGSADMDPGPGVITLTAVGFTEDLFVLKLNQTGSAVWAKRIGGPSVYGEMGYSISAHEDGSVYVGGNFAGTVDFDPGAGVFNMTSIGNSDAFLLKLDAAGNFVWAKSFGNSANATYINRIEFTPAGKVLVAGPFGETIDFDPGPGVFNHTSNGDWDVFLMQLDSNGNFEWAKSHGGEYLDYCEEIRLDADANIYTCGRYRDTVDFDPGPGVYNMTTASSSTTNGYLLKLDPDGNFIWAKNIGSAGWSSINGLEINDDQTIFFMGEFSAITDLDMGPGTHLLTSMGSRDAFVQKADTAGNFIWAAGFGGAGGEYARGFDVRNGEEIYTSGQFELTADFDPAATTDNHLCNGGHDIFVHKILDACNLETDVTQTANNLYSEMDNVSYQWVNCDQNYQHIPGETNQAFTAALPGNYAVIISNGVCKDTSECLSVVCDQPTVATVTQNETTLETVVPGTYQWVNCDQNYAPVLNENSAIFNPTAPGNYALILSNGWCADTSGCFEIFCFHPVVPTVTQNGNTLESSTSSGTYQWVNCNTGYTPVDGATTPIFTPEIPGMYAVILSDGICTDTSDCHAISCEQLVDLSVSQDQGILTAAMPGATYQWFDCAKGTILANQNNQSFSPITNGSYAVIISTPGCTDTTACIHVNYMSFGSVENHFSIYPNPADETIMITISIPAFITIRDIKGRELLNFQAQEPSPVIDISSLPAGTYLVQIITETGLNTARLVVK